MDPTADAPPRHHCRGAAGIIGVLLASEDNSSPVQASREANLNLQSQSQPSSGNQAVPLPPITNTPPVNDADQVAPVAPSRFRMSSRISRRPHLSLIRSRSRLPASSSSGGPTVLNRGKTLAQLFRDHNLPPTDVYAMAQVEGAGKPLSSLQTGQTVQIRQNASGVVTGLTIDTGGGQQVLFTRQSNGSFIRVR